MEACLDGDGDASPDIAGAGEVGGSGEVGRAVVGAGVPLPPAAAGEARGVADWGGIRLDGVRARSAFAPLRAGRAALSWAVEVCLQIPVGMAARLGADGEVGLNREPGEDRREVAAGVDAELTVPGDTGDTGGTGGAATGEVECASRACRQSPAGARSLRPGGRMNGETAWRTVDAACCAAGGRAPSAAAALNVTLLIPSTPAPIVSNRRAERPRVGRGWHSAGARGTERLPDPFPARWRGSWGIG